MRHEPQFQSKGTMPNTLQKSCYFWPSYSPTVHHLETLSDLCQLSQNRPFLLTKMQSSCQSPSPWRVTAVSQATEIQLKQLRIVPHFMVDFGATSGESPTPNSLQ